MPRFNPFRPGTIVTPGMFCGRVDELVAIEAILFQTRAGNPQHFLIHGERGIGKSALFLFLETVAHGQVESIQSGYFNFLTVNIELDPSTTYLDIIHRIARELKKQVALLTPGLEKLKTTWEFLKRWEVLGVKYAGAQRPGDEQEPLDEMTMALEQVARETKGLLDGILILIDEAEKPEAAANLGGFAKLLTEKSQRRAATTSRLVLRDSLQ